jgi:hypothetical protein
MNGSLVGDDSPFLLTPDDLAAFGALLQAQQALGPAVSAPAQAQFWSFYAAIDALGYGRYTAITNSLLKGWVDRLYPVLVTTPTVYGISAAGMYGLYAYSTYTISCGDLDSCHDQGYPSDWQHRGGVRAPWYCQPVDRAPWIYFLNFWHPPAAPSSLLSALTHDLEALDLALASGPPATDAVGWLSGWAGGTQPDLAAVRAFEQSRFDPAHWSDSHRLVQGLVDSGLWTSQTATARTLSQSPALTGEQYLFLLCLLTALATSTATERQWAQRLLTSVASSREYPNDLVANQLVYAVLMNLADPDGPYDDTHDDLLSRVGGWLEWTTGADPVSQVLHTALAHHQRLLRADAAYPLQDPYAPSIGFTQRQTDTLFALDKARHAVGPLPTATYQQES